MVNLAELDLSEWERWCRDRGEPRFRAQQLFQWVQAKGTLDPDSMSNLPKELRRRVAESFDLQTLRCKALQESSDGETTKFLWELADGKLLESVLIRAPGRRTLCVSSQVGCAARCAFCASGKKGLMRNLSKGEIVEQVLRVNGLLASQGERISHVVFMGMGEPMDNLDAVLGAIRLLNHEKGLNISKRRITVSTVGVIEGIHRLCEERLGVSLVLSLHAPNQGLRQKLMPYARRNPMNELLKAMDRYAQTTGRDATYEYILIQDFNAGSEHAEELAALLKGRQCTVNLIPYNPVPRLRLQKPKPAEIQEFRAVLSRRGVVNTCRYTKGDDIAAACGQLALQE